MKSKHIPPVSIKLDIQQIAAGQDTHYAAYLPELPMRYASNNTITTALKCTCHMVIQA
ncbi:hypothetical protein [Vibrio breoganii]|uniref:hypothetical protein n=1 Tax=Vibrio breoganii TaxID=553239 RepID=UPI00036B2D16|nr:hypothetical protein [Vibrio breoganii]